MALHKQHGRGGVIDPDLIPASIINRIQTEPMREGWDGGRGTPFGGGTFLPHIFTVAGRYGIAAKTYAEHDEAIIDSRENAELMRNELAITECLEQRIRSTVMLNWHIEPLDDSLDDRAKESLRRSKWGKPSRWESEEIAAKLSQLLNHTRQLKKLFWSLSEAIWYGRYGTKHFIRPRVIDGFSNRAFVIHRWEPIHGDKILFRYDDGSYRYDPEQIGIRIGPGYSVQKTWTDFVGNQHLKVEPTQYGLAYWLDGSERSVVAVHKHLIEDGEFYNPLKAGSVHGVGIRSKVYWTWYAYEECLKLLLEYIERSALGIEIWRYPAHNPQAKQEAAAAAQQRGAPGRSILMVPVPEGENADLYDVQIVEPGLQGADVLQGVLEKFFGHKIKRYILGQTSTSESDTTGLGSGITDAHRATYSDIIRFDAISLADTITHEIVRPLQLLNFPGSEGIYLQFKFDTESPFAQEKLDGYRAIWEMGGEIRADDLYSVIGAARPHQDDDVLTNPQFDPAMMGGGMGGAMGGMGMDPMMGMGGGMPGMGGGMSAEQPAMDGEIDLDQAVESLGGIEGFSADWRRPDPAGSQDMLSLANGVPGEERLISAEPAPIKIKRQLCEDQANGRSTDRYVGQHYVGELMMRPGSDGVPKPYRLNQNFRWERAYTPDWFPKGSQLGRGKGSKKVSRGTTAGQLIGGSRYIHRDYVHKLGAQKKMVQEAIKTAQEKYPDFEWTVAKIENDSVIFMHSPDFNESHDPIVGQSYKVRGAFARAIPQMDDEQKVLHHKWMFVEDDYPGFDVGEEKERSQTWMSMPDLDYSRIGDAVYWKSHVEPRIDKALGVEEGRKDELTDPEPVEDTDRFSIEHLGHKIELYEKFNV